MSVQTLLLFVAMELVYSFTPGPAVLLVSTYGFRKGFGAAFAAVLGIETGNTIYLLISAAGLGALLATSALAFEIVKWAGAAYLVFLGSWTIWRAGKDVPNEKRRALSHPYVQALLTQLGNPKTVLFFGALLPQFLDVHRPLWPQYLIMWAIVAAGETLIVGGYGWIAAQGNKLVRPRFAAWRERASGAVMIFIGAIFATVRGANVDLAEFIHVNTELLSPPLVPEVTLHLATEMVPLWRKSEEELQAMGVPPPYWAFAWAGGQALARYVLDNPDVVRSKHVLDFGSGSGLVGIAAMKAGARSVLSADIDKYAAATIALNAQANGVAVTTTTDDLIGRDGDWDIILIGDMCYERPLAERLLAWLHESGANALLGDPGRSYFPKTDVERLALYNVQVTRDLEDREIRETGVYRLTGAGPV